ncbi:hypothetical protein HDEF_1564 [Candidatus Hamiltonella defensa 5AT (Acyrthosiphon pisum)]|uniref:Uncharacterized protein n=1 Tax=Hamiltonella defensa subsp. Acyrthosiphon pisum (strain 5AT) TaxID=572265 RepID=C4K6I7_HAMD5|nr:hypothetical protein HDEF_1564 [Candidatus Hamiltonella defensa 5AT (Acyrthosiphon pisum)]
MQGRDGFYGDVHESVFFPFQCDTVSMVLRWLKLYYIILLKTGFMLFAFLPFRQG